MGVRKQLRRRDGVRAFFTGVFVRMGMKKGYDGEPEKTILLRSIRDSEGNAVANHLWFSYTKGFQDLGKIEKGSIISFWARVKPYTKGYVSWRDDIDERRTDYKLSHPTKVSLMQKQQSPLCQGG